MRVHPVVLIALLLGCSTFGDDECGRVRSVEAQGLISRPQFSDSIVRIRVTDSEDPRFDFDDVSWVIPVSTQGDSITAIHLHDGTEEQDEGILYLFPDNDAGPGFALTSVASYDYSTPIATLFELMRAGHTYVDVHTASQPEGTARAELTSVHFEDWTGYSCST